MWYTLSILGACSLRGKDRPPPSGFLRQTGREVRNDISESNTDGAGTGRGGVPAYLQLRSSGDCPEPTEYGGRGSHPGVLRRAAPSGHADRRVCGVLAGHLRHGGGVFPWYRRSCPPLHAHAGASGAASGAADRHWHAAALCRAAYPQGGAGAGGQYVLRGRGTDLYRYSAVSV